MRQGSRAHRALGLALALSALGRADTLKNRRDLMFRQSPVEEVKGRLEIDAAAARQLLHHRFRFDDQGRPTEIVRAVGERLTRNEGSFGGFLWWAPPCASSTWPAQRAALLRPGRPAGRWRLGHTALPTGAPGAGPDRRCRFNRRGKSAPVRPDFLFHRVRFEFGHDDLLDFMFNIDAKGETSASPTGSAADPLVYDPWGNIHRWQVFNQHRHPHNGHATDVATGEFVHDALGQVRMLRGFGPQGEDRAIVGLGGPTSFEHDRHGDRVRQQLRTMNGELVRESRQEYSADGSRRLAGHYFDAQGRPASPTGLPPDRADMKPLPAPPC
ncbi:MAG: hypothetical protein IV092_20215 [Burkholderiaceae bacterium]|nr:hypothetical protein [Burkholderiaceae bacterium]